MSFITVYNIPMGTDGMPQITLIVYKKNDPVWLFHYFCQNLALVWIHAIHGLTAQRTFSNRSVLSCIFPGNCNFYKKNYYTMDQIWRYPFHDRKADRPVNVPFSNLRFVAVTVSINRWITSLPVACVLPIKLLQSPQSTQKSAPSAN